MGCVDSPRRWTRSHWPIGDDVQAENSQRPPDTLPFEAEVDAGGAVSFIISGLHQILIYGPDRELADVKAAAAGLNRHRPGPLPPLVNYATDRVYRGLDPRVLQSTLPVTGDARPSKPSHFNEPGRSSGDLRCRVPHFTKAGTYS